VFAANLKQLLLTPPVRGKSILGVDPGFVNGCKFAVISATGKQTPIKPHCNISCCNLQLPVVGMALLVDVCL